MSGAIFDTGTTDQASRIFWPCQKMATATASLENRTPGYARSSNLSNQCARWQMFGIPPLQLYTTNLTITIINYLHLCHSPAKPRHCPPCPPVPLVQEQEQMHQDPAQRDLRRVKHQILTYIDPLWYFLLEQPVKNTWNTQACGYANCSSLPHLHQTHGNVLNKVMQSNQLKIPSPIWDFNNCHCNVPLRFIKWGACVVASFQPFPYRDLLCMVHYYLQVISECLHLQRHSN